MAAEPSTPPTATTNADDDRETPEPRHLTAPAAPAAPPRPPTPFRLPTRSDYGEVPPTTRLRKRSPPPPDEVAWSPPPRAEHARQTKKPRRFVEVDQDVPAGAWREGSPRAASPSLVFAAPSSAAFVPATRWPEAAAAFAAAVATEGSAERLDNLGAALLRAGRRGEARDAFERALVLDPRDERARRGAAEARR